MKYINAQRVLPKLLLEEVQKYVQGEMVYIPKPPEHYQKWGANTQTRDLIARRNCDITRAFQAGAAILELADAYYLSADTIKKIVYRQRR